MFSACQQNAKDTNNSATTVQDSSVQTQSNENTSTPPEMHPPDQQPLTPAPNPEPQFGLAQIDALELIENKKPNDVTIMLHGTLPSPCTHLAESVQTNRGNKIELTVKTVLPPGVICPPTPIPINHGIPLKTQGLKPGKYEISVNGKTVIYEKK
jgi:hypothetical protein